MKQLSYKQTIQDTRLPGRVNLLRLLVCLALFCSCRTPETVVRTIKEVQVAEHTDSVFIDRWHTAELRHDTMFLRDSIWFSRTILQHDSIFIHDTMVVETSIPKTQKNVTIKPKEKILIGLLIISLLFVFFNKQTKNISSELYQRIRRGSGSGGAPRD